MIKLELPDKPTQLTQELQDRLTQNFRSDNKATVWHIGWLKDAILDMSFKKCCFSEIRLDEESKYMEVEHFYPKSLYPNKVMEWGNLIPSCKKCNIVKGNHDTLREPIINPFVDNPKEHLYFRAYRYYAKTGSILGQNTIDVLPLNDREHFVNPRFKIGIKLIENLEDLYENRTNFTDAKKSRKSIYRLEGLMKQGDRKEEYAALVSTVILEEPAYENIKLFLQQNKIWNHELQDLEDELKYCALWV